MEYKICTMRKIEKHIKNCYNKFSESKDCNSKRELQRYCEHKDKISNQRRIYCGKTEIKNYRIKMIERYILKNKFHPKMN